MAHMEWHNLASFTCPYCSGNLRRSGGEVLCTECIFRITADRFMAILQNRKQNPTSTTPYRWQNLKHDNCPIDGEMLRDKIGKYEVLECSNGDCSFHIRFDRMREILADINHPANKFALTV